MTIFEPYKLQMGFDDVDQFTETVRAWDLDFWQLERGGFRSELSQVGLGNFELGRAKFNRRLHQTGLSPNGGRTFVIPNSSRLSLRWRGHDVAADQLLCFPKNRQLESCSDSSFDILTLTVAEDYLGKKLDRLEMRGGLSLLDEAEVCVADPRLMMALRMQLNRMHDTSSNSLIRSQAQLDAELDELLGYLLTTWIRRRAGARKAISRSRSRVLKDAIAYIELRGRQTVSVRELCVHVGVSERTLQYVFQEAYQVTPKQYIQLRRLHGVRKELLARPYRPVGDVAAEWGFWHMGQFAADYKKLFGEVPSATVKRVLS